MRSIKFYYFKVLGTHLLISQAKGFRSWISHVCYKMQDRKNVRRLDRDLKGFSLDMYVTLFVIRMF